MKMLLHLVTHHIVNGHQTEDTGLPHTALTVTIAAGHSRDDLRQLTLQILHLHFTNNLWT